ncbi:MAG TPA: transcriptional regulator [Abditibacteriaceae bacterium]|jgi:HTH-type transcriptional regulator/antitoxin HigA
MKAKVIKTPQEHEAALARIEEIFGARPGTPEGDELELLSLLVELYEAEQFPIEWPDAVTALRFRMEQQGLKQKDLVPFIGSPAKVSEVLTKQRGFSLAMIKNLVAGLGIPPEVFLHSPSSSSKTAVRPLKRKTSSTKRVATAK